MYNKLTKADIKRLEEEIEHRKLVVRPAAIEAVKEARAQGDLSENFEYYVAKRDKNKNESRIRYLERMIKTAHIIEDTSGDDEVGVDDTVEVYFVEDEETEVYTLVTKIRGDSLNHFITIESPLGKAMLHKKVGERFQVRVNENYTYEAEIKKITKA